MGAYADPCRRRRDRPVFCWPDIRGFEHSGLVRLRLSGDRAACSNDRTRRARRRRRCQISVGRRAALAAVRRALHPGVARVAEPLTSARLAPADGVFQSIIAPEHLAAGDESRYAEYAQAACFAGGRFVSFGGRLGCGALDDPACILANLVEASRVAALASRLLVVEEPVPIGRPYVIGAPAFGGANDRNAVGSVGVLERVG